MPRSTKDKRQIVVDGRTFFWRIGDVYDRSSRMFLFMQFAAYSPDGGTSRLVADILSRGPIRHVIYKVSHVMPRHAEALIRHALRRGWDPTARAEDHHIVDADPILAHVEWPSQYGPPSE